MNINNIALITLLVLKSDFLRKKIHSSQINKVYYFIMNG